MVKWKSGIMEMLKAAGYSTYKIRKEKIFGQMTLQQFREEAELGNTTVDRLCKLLGCQPGDLLEYVPDEEELSE